MIRIDLDDAKAVEFIRSLGIKTDFDRETGKINVDPVTLGNSIGAPANGAKFTFEMIIKGGELLTANNLDAMLLSATFNATATGDPAYIHWRAIHRALQEALDAFVLIEQGKK